MSARLCDGEEVTTVEFKSEENTMAGCFIELAAWLKAHEDDFVDLTLKTFLNDEGEHTIVAYFV